MTGTDFGDDTTKSEDKTRSESLDLKINHTEYSNSVALVGKGRFLAMAGRGNVDFLLDFSSMRIEKLFTGDRRGGHLIAGTANKLFCMSESGDEITRFDLKTFQKEKSVLFPELAKGVGVDLIAGAYGNGPLGVITKRGDSYGLVLLDIETLDVANPKPFLVSPDCQVSSDGRVFSCVLENRLLVYDLDHLRLNETLPATKSLLEVTAPQGYAPTNFNGSVVFCQFGPLSRGGVPLFSGGRFPIIDGIVVPSSQGNLFAFIGNSQANRFNEPKSYATIYSVGDIDPIGVVLNLPLATETEGRSLNRMQPTIPSFKRFWLVPEHEAIAVIGVHHIHIRKFSVAAELKKRPNVLFIDSVPPANAFAGSTLRHEIDVVATKGPYTLHLQEAPADAKLVHNVFSWDVPNDVEAGEVVVRIEIQDSGGQKIEYPIPLQVIQHSSSGNKKEVKPKISDSPPKKSSSFEMRNWKDQSDMVIGRGRFVRILDKKHVEIEREDGSLEKLDVKVLSLEDIRYALAMSKATKTRE